MATDLNQEFFAQLGHVRALEAGEIWTEALRRGGRFHWSQDELWEIAKLLVRISEHAFTFGVEVEQEICRQRLLRSR